MMSDCIYSTNCSYYTMTFYEHQLATVLVMEPTVIYDLLLYLICCLGDTDVNSVTKTDPQNTFPYTSIQRT